MVAAAYVRKNHQRLLWSRESGSHLKPKDEIPKAATKCMACMRNSIVSDVIKKQGCVLSRRSRYDVFREELGCNAL